METYIITAFLVGLWCILSSARHISCIKEAVILTMITIIVKTIIEWGNFPIIDKIFIITWLILFIYTAIILRIIETFSSHSLSNAIIAIGGATGWFFLANYVFSDTGIELINNSLNILKYSKTAHL